MRSLIAALTFVLAGAVTVPAQADSAITPPVGDAPVCLPYDQEAQMAIMTRRQVQVMLCFHVETNGSVKDANVVQSSGDKMVDRDAEQCASTWHFTPAMKNGAAVEYAMIQPLSWCATENTVHRKPCVALARSDEFKTQCEKLLGANGQSAAPAPAH